MTCARCATPMKWANLEERCPSVPIDVVRFFSITQPMWGGVNLLNHIWQKEHR